MRQEPGNTPPNAAQSPASAPAGATTPVLLHPSFFARFTEALQITDFRRFVLAIACFTGAIQIQGTAQGWLVYHLTGSSLAIGVVQSLSSLMILLLSPLGGVLADRFEKKQIIIISWVGAGLIFGALSVLIFTHQIQMWHLFVGSVLSGLVFSFNITARFGLISQLVRDNLLKNAMATVALTFNLNGLVFPLIGGVLIDVAGVGAAYASMTVLFFLAVLMATRVSTLGVLHRTERTSILRDFAVGVGYVKAQPALLALLCVAFASVWLGQPYTVLLPQLAEETLHAPASGLGLLFAMIGLGGIVGNVLLASLNTDVRLGRLVLAMTAGAGICLLGLALAKSMLAGAVVLFGLGLLGMPAFTICESLLQRHTPPEMRGRIMSLYMVGWGLYPIGMLVSSALADYFGLWLPLTIDGIGMVIVSVVILRFFPVIHVLNVRHNLPGPTRDAGQRLS